MNYPLEAPQGWFLYSAAHEHTKITFATDFHVPLPHPEGPWLVQFQKYPKGGNLQEGRGHTLIEAWEKATEKAHERNTEAMIGKSHGTR